MFRKELDKNGGSCDNVSKQSITLPFYPVKRKLHIFQGVFCPFINGWNDFAAKICKRNGAKL